MRAQNADPLRQIAEQVADCFAERGYAFVEDDKIEGLAALLESFLTVAGIPANLPGTGDPIPSGHDLPSIGQPMPARSGRYSTAGTVLP
jgi:hypothetical protein